LRNLGSQRFPLPPYWENFELWSRSLNLTLAEFESTFQLSSNQEYQSRKGAILQRLRDGLDSVRKMEQRSEQKFMQLRAKLDSATRTAVDAEADFKQTWHRLERERDLALRSLKGQLKALKKQQASAKTGRGGLLRRLFGRGLTQASDVGRQIEATGDEIRTASQSTEEKMRISKQQYGERTGALKEQVEALRKELETLEKASQVNDGLDIRREACSALEAILRETVKIAPGQEAPTQPRTS
jgi:hypothetical protein